jgi:hypothetical protein
VSSGVNESFNESLVSANQSEEGDVGPAQVKESSSITVGQVEGDVNVDLERLTASAQTKIVTIRADGQAEVDTPVGDASAEGFAEGPAAEAVARAGLDGAAGKVGASAGDVGADAGIDIAGEHLGIGGQIGLKAELGFKVGSDVRLDLPLGSIEVPNIPLAEAEWAAKAVKNLAADPGGTIEGASHDVANAAVAVAGAAGLSLGDVGAGVGEAVSGLADVVSPLGAAVDSVENNVGAAVDSVEDNVGARPVKPGSLLDLVSTRFAAEAAVVGFVWFAVAGLRWFRRRGSPVPASVEAVEFSGRRRAAFLERVWSQRIVNGLERSLQHASEMYLGMRNTPDLVKPSYAQSTAEPGEVLAVEEAFDQAGGQLLIVGPPGSGKTTEALKLMRHLLEVARTDPSAPVPEIFSLASWAKERKPLLEWLADQLQLHHGWSPRQGRSLIWGHHVVPVLDGLDEVASESRAECLEEINRFWETHRGGPIVLCSREAEYEELSEKLKLGGGVTVCPPDARQIDEYLAATGSSWDGVRDQLRAGSSPFIQELLTTPLMLSIAVLAYQNQDPSELSEVDDVATQRERLWSHYVTTVISREHLPAVAVSEDAPRYSEMQVRRWLGWLAKEMASRNETELWLHEWSGPPHVRNVVKVVLGL